MLIHYIIPFRDDFRYYDFPPLSTEEMGKKLYKYLFAISVKHSTFPDQQQLDQIGDYVDSMMLCSDDGYFID